MSDSSLKKSNRSRRPVLDIEECRRGAPFLMVGERMNVSGSARFARFLKEDGDEEILEIARRQVMDGAGMLDLNVDDPAVDSKAEMRRVLGLLASDREIAGVPVMIDSAHWEVLEAGLAFHKGPAVANSLNLKGGEEQFRDKAGLVHDCGAAVVFMAFDEDGLARTRDRKVEVCTRGYRILTEDIGFLPEDVILDPAILAVGTGLQDDQGNAISFIEACRTLKAELPRCLVSGGVSNLSFAYRGNDLIRQAMHTLFLRHAIEAGMDMGIVNVHQLGVYEEIPDEIRKPIEDLILNRSAEALAQVMELAVRTRGRE